MTKTEPEKSVQTAKNESDEIELQLLDKPLNKLNDLVKLNLKATGDDQVMLKLKEKKAQNYSSLLEKVFKT